MFCNFCQAQRPANEAPCPNCGAPSPLLKVSHNGNWETGGGAEPTATQGWQNNGSNASWNQGSGAQWQQRAYSFNNEGPNGTMINMQTWNQPDAGPNGTMINMQTWNKPDAGPNGTMINMQPWNKQNMGPHGTMIHAPLARQGYEEQGSAQVEFSQNDNSGQSMLPALYNPNVPALPQPTMTLQLVPDQLVESMLPAPVENGYESATYVPPMYTKPRPIIPKYRAISGLIAFLIVVMASCGGLGYYMQTTGKFAAIANWYNGTRPPNIETAATPITDADKLPMAETGPASDKIVAPATALQINESTQKPVREEKVFAPNQEFYITFTLPKGEEGKVVLKWYTNDVFYYSEEIEITKEKLEESKIINGLMKFSYPMAGVGKVELYWNDELAHAIYFLIKS